MADQTNPAPIVSAAPTMTHTLTPGPAGALNFGVLSGAVASGILAAMGRVLLVHPDRWLDVARAVAADMASAPDPQADTRFRGERGAGFYRVDRGTAVLPIIGPTVSRGFGGVSYEAFRHDLRTAVADPKVERIVLAIDSPGGMVSGIDSAAAAIQAARLVKPVVAHVEGMAASAGYWLAAQADEIVATGLSRVGSIGVLTMHVDFSRALADLGVKPTLIYAGAHKVDANPFEPLPQGVREDIQAEVDSLRLAFARAVADGRGGRIKSDEVIATEARMFPADRAVSAGLIDRVASLDEVIATPTRRSARTGTMMSTNTNPTQEAQTPTPTPAATAPQAPSADALAAARAEGAAAERTRFAAILGDEKVAGRERAAIDLAVKAPTMSAADVASFVSTAIPAAGSSAPAPAASLANRVPAGNPLGAAGASDAPAPSAGMGDAVARFKARRGIK